MVYHILAVGDVVMEPGLRCLERHLRPVQKLKGIDFTVVNGENAAGVGLTREQAERIYDAGADVVTLGNHAFGKSQIADFLEDAPWLLRPANYSGRAPGRGCGIYDLGAVRIRVINLIGRCGLAWGADNPFTAADRLLAEGMRTSPWWTSTRRPPVRSWPWAAIWTGGCPPCGAPIPTCPPPTSGCGPGAPGTSRTWA